MEGWPPCYRRGPSARSPAAAATPIVIALVVITAAVTLAFTARDDDADVRSREPGPVAERTPAAVRERCRRRKRRGNAGAERSRTVAVRRNGSDPRLEHRRHREAVYGRARSDETGVTDDEITIGQIVTDSSSIPQQFNPAHEGLDAFVQPLQPCRRPVRTQAQARVPQRHVQSGDPRTGRRASSRTASSRSSATSRCSISSTTSSGRRSSRPFRGRRIVRPGRRWPRVLVCRAGQSSLARRRDRQRVADPRRRRAVPLLPTEAKAQGNPCKKAGVVYLQEPTGASEDQARVGAVSLEESWGAGLGADNTQLYAAGLFDSTLQYESHRRADASGRDELRVRLHRPAVEHQPRQGDAEPRRLATEHVQGRGLLPRLLRPVICVRREVRPGRRRRGAGREHVHPPRPADGDRQRRDAGVPRRDQTSSTRRPSTFSVLGFASGADADRGARAVQRSTDADMPHGVAAEDEELHRERTPRRHHTVQDDARHVSRTTGRSTGSGSSTRQSRCASPRRTANATSIG